MRKTPKLTDLVYRKGAKQWNAWMIKVHATNLGTFIYNPNGIVGAGKTADGAGRDFQKQWRAKQARLKLRFRRTFSMANKEYPASQERGYTEEEITKAAEHVADCLRLRGYATISVKGGTLFFFSKDKLNKMMDNQKGEQFTLLVEHKTAENQN